MIQRQSKKINGIIKERVCPIFTFYKWIWQIILSYVLLVATAKIIPYAVEYHKDDCVE